jgi:hypothetical protein
MSSGLQVLLACLLALALLLAVFGPPAWWFWHDRKPGERREKRWGAIVLGALLIISMGYLKPAAKGDWVGWLVNIGRLVCGSWMIAWGAKGSRIS